MIRIPLILYILLCSVAVYAKDSIDLLTRQLSAHSTADTVKVNLLNKLGYEYWIVDPAHSELLGKDALKLADSLGYTEGKAFAHRIIGVSLWARGQYPAALQYLMDGLTLYKQNHHAEGIASMLNNIGLVYHDQESYPLALTYFYQAIATYEQSGARDSQAGILGNIGNTYMQMKNYTKAEKIYTQVLHANRATGRKYGVAESLSNLGELHLLRNHTAKALTYFVESLEIRSSIEDHEGSAMCHYLIGKVYLAQKQYPLSRQYLQKGIEKATQVNSLKWLTSLYQTLKDVEVASGNPKRAVAYFEVFATYKDSLFNAEKSRQITEIQTRFETLKKEQKLQAQSKQLALLQEQSRFQKLLQNSLLMGLFAISIITYLIVSRQRLKIKRNKELLAKNEEIFFAEQALAQAKLENARLQEIKLLQELESTHKKLTSYSLNFIQKNELMEEVKSSIDELKKIKGGENLKELNGINRLVESSIQIDKDWEDFKRNFEQVHKDFYQILKVSYPDLTNHELKLCTLLKLNMNLKEAAAIMGISPESVKKARFRLRKKLNLSREDNLIDHIIAIEKHNDTFCVNAQVA